ncbi:intradiol ring-cleavage dioxygenase [Jiella sp. MQZ9-1]|uniref:Intradiol ring-cleavage dioxygenase n=1 Tax=Jiella flava TaxID=2816857 RepID=A0A939JVB0_9HYPH|nr:intradiol ring-cleavage dioxygenase [Jiella flava]MBO0661807.1 intradiol ring-cleavage dioxygenase [Jiella flava]MCD2470448.1 intradiol ring-cleavage dioxygenase [Jiella flava]
MEKPKDSGFALNRRQALTAIAVTASGAMIPRAAFAVEQSNAAMLVGATVCRLLPDVTEGPYYVDDKLVRADITEGRPGVPVLLRLQVVDATCQPLAKARVDVWHCDATGLYSNYGGQGDDHDHPVSTKGETFLRGTQMSDANGLVNFTTIYPGWYRSRTTHIHFKVFLSATNVLTGQIFFPYALSQFIYDKVPPYSMRKAVRDTLNASDGIAREAGAASHAAITEQGTRYLAALIVGVDPAAKSNSAEGFNGPPMGEGKSGPPPGGFGGPDGPGGAGGPPPERGDPKASLVPGVAGIIVSE